MEYVKMCPHQMLLGAAPPGELEIKHKEYGEKFNDHLRRTWEKIYQGKAGVEVVDWKGDICEPHCLYSYPEYCNYPGSKISKKEAIIRDTEEIKKFGLKIGDKLTPEEFFNVLRKRLGGHLSLCSEMKLGNA